jgi:hypothetical protein
MTPSSTPDSNALGTSPNPITTGLAPHDDTTGLMAGANVRIFCPSIDSRVSRRSLPPTPKGHKVGPVAPNGAGKTILSGFVAGDLAADGGSVTVSGRARAISEGFEPARFKPFGLNCSPLQEVRAALSVQGSPKAIPPERTRLYGISGKP